MNLAEHIFTSIPDLSGVDRYSGISLVKSESVTSHIVQAFYIGVSVGMLVKKNCDIEFSIENFAYRCMIHDVDEFETCDIPRNVKYANPRILKELEAIAANSVAIISNRIKYDIYGDWSSCKDSSIEGRILRLADLLCVVAKVRDEIVYRRNLHMLPVAKGSIAHLKKLICEYQNGPAIDVADATLTRIADDAVDLLKSIYNEYSI